MSDGKYVIIPVFIPHKGCPFDCSYCNQKTISGQMEEMTVDRMREIIEAHLATIEPGTIVEIAFYGGSFTGIEEEQQKAFLETAQAYVNQQKVRGIRLSTRPDYISPSILETLRRYAVKAIELGVQSLDEKVLALSTRGHNASQTMAAAALIKEFGFMLGIQTMTGLPGDTRDKSLATARKVIELKPSIVRIYPTLVIQGTDLAKLYMDGKYQPQQLEEAVELCAELLELYQTAHIQVIRIGLQPTDEISLSKGVLAGPFHPAFRQLVESRLCLNQIEKQIQEVGLENQPFVIKTGEKNLSNVIGQHKGNLKYLMKKCGHKKIQVIPVEGMGKGVHVEKL